MVDLPKRSRRGMAALPASTEVVPYCQSCSYRFGQMGDVELTSARLALATQVAIECPECFAKGIPVQEPKSRPAEPLAPPDIPVPVRRIIESVFHFDYEAEWKDLRGKLAIGLERSDYLTVAAHVDHGQDWRLRGHQLYINVKREYERYKVEREIVWATIRDEANSVLQREKDAGARNKSITDADVTAKMAELHPDEYRRIEMEKKEFELAVEQYKAFADCWADRPRDLNSMLNGMKR